VLHQITIDHSVVQEMVDAGLLRAEDAEGHPDSNVITRAVGFDTEQSPDYWRVPARPGLRLLACSDGLTKELSTARIEAILAETEDSLGAATNLVDAAVEAGGRDNVTAVVVDVRSASGHGPVED
jgi:serine/threonine protein phosphatase PrpC